MLHYLKYIFDEVDRELKHKKKHFVRYHVHRFLVHLFYHKHNPFITTTVENNIF